MRTRTGPKDVALKKARVCYNHLAGEMGTRLYEHFIEVGHLRPGAATLHLTEPGRDFARNFGIDIEALSRGRALLCRECLDWSERTSHLAGSLGRAIYGRMEALGWARRANKTRAVVFSAHGERAFDRLLRQS